MATKLQLVTAMYDHQIKHITDNARNWTEFLRSASRNYKLRFDEQLLVHAQRPDATAVLELESWNRQFKRWVNSGARGIAVIDRKNPTPMRLKYYFDISDTHESIYSNSRPVPIWEMRPEYEADVIETLEATFGELSEKDTLADAIIAAANNAVTDNLADYLYQLNLCRNDSFLEELDELNVEVTYRNALINSVAYLWLSRCGLDPAEYFDTDDFPSIYNFNTPDTVNALGLATSDIAEMGLREIASTIRTFEKQRENRDNHDKSITERSFEHGHADIHRGERLPDTRPDRAGGSGVSPWQIRVKTPGLPDEAPRNPVHEPVDAGQTQRTPNGDRPDGAAAVRPDGITDGGGARRDGAAKADRPDGVGGQDEQHPPLGGGSDTQRADLQLTLPTPEEQQRSIEEAEVTANADTTSVFSMSGVVPQEAIDEALSSGGVVENGKYRIVEHFSKNLTAKENSDFVRDEFGWGGVGPAYGLGVGFSVTPKGLEITRGTSWAEKATIFLSWSQASRRIKELIAADRFLNPKEKEIYPQWLENQRESRRQRAEERAAAEILRREPAPAEPPHSYQYHLGDTVYIGAHEYEVLAFDENTVRLYDTEFPLFNQEFPRAEFDQKIAENPLNAHLRVIADPMQEAGSAQVAQAIAEPESGQEEYTPLPGDRYEIQGRLFEVDSVSEEYGSVSLRDITFQQGVGFPIFRRESLDFIRQYAPINIERAVSEHEPEPPLAGNQHIENIGGVEYIVTTPFAKAKQPSKRESGVNFPGEIELVKDHIPQPGEPEQAEPTIIPAWEQKKKPARVNYFDAFPDTPMSERHNFRITDDNLGVGGAKTKFRANMDAIHLLHDLELDGRLATPEEQETLSRYVGWGSLPQAFDPDKADWADEFLELQTSLSAEEYESARATTLNAHYTSPVVIKAIYKAIENMGFQTGNILDPGCGIGNFQGLLPDSMASSKIYGIEIDPITGRIAQQLYQKNSIAIQGYEKTPLPDSFFDLAVGNVPFGGYGVSDKKYDRYHFLIHDYFFAKTLDKVRPGGVIAFITSKGTMDKANPAVRKYLAERADLLGAIRLPNNAFLANAGTQVTTDIIFLQKRENVQDKAPEWIHLAKSPRYELTENDYEQFGVMDTQTGKLCSGEGMTWYSTKADATRYMNRLQDRDTEYIPVNQYFADHPEMVLGEMARDDMMYGNGNETTCNPYPDRELVDLLDEAIQNIHAEIPNLERADDEPEADSGIPADPTVRNFSFCLVDDKIYYRENSLMFPRELTATAQSRVRGMIELRDCVRTLIEYQTEDYPDSDIRAEQAKLNRLYDAYTHKYGLLNDRANSLAFDDDSSYALLCSLEILDDDRKLKAKADMFTKRTIRPPVTITHCDTPVEALAMSMSEKGRVDMEFMSELTGKDTETLFNDLRGVVFLDLPESPGVAARYVTADEFLSGNVREKLAVYSRLAQLAPDSHEQRNVILENVRALEAAQPKDLEAPEISIRLGAAWVPPDIITSFIYYLLDTPWRAQSYIDVLYSEHTAEWNVTGKSYDGNNVKAFNTYGTRRMNAYWIIENTLNLRDVRIYDTIHDPGGKEVRVLNKKETAIAQDKQDLIKEKFLEWVWSDPDRRERLCQIYNERFNSIRPREYDGSHLTFPGMNPEIRLDSHQVNAIARHIYGGNTLLGHTVGAGKTYTMIAAAMEGKRLGLCDKPMFVVPNNIIGDFAGDFFRLYPAANVLMATAKDFEKKNRRRFCARIATGSYDGIVIAHSQFEKLAMSPEWQSMSIERQIDDITAGIATAKSEKGEKFTIKQMEKTRKSLEVKLEKLNDQSRKDDLIDFEQLGIDRLFIDEADMFKNLYFVTKMRNVAGINQSDAQKAADLFMKTRYMDGLTGNRGVVFATGTPVSNTMAEVYTMQRYLQYDALVKQGLDHFDCWASTFGETVTSMEITPDGTGFQSKTRFSRFYNLPELMNMFREVADIQTKDMLGLPVPKVNYHVEVCPPSEMQREMVRELGNRADRIRRREVDPTQDNMLLITNDGRKIALDQRIINPLLPDFEGSKVNRCVSNVFDIWARTSAKRLTQILFCDLSTPNGMVETVEVDGVYQMTDFQNVYEDIRRKLIARGVPENEIAFVHEAKNELQKKELFAKVRTGKVRIILGSTSKCGAGTNMQDKLVALHDLDCPWRPRDLEQRLGRIERRGNTNPEVEVYRYISEHTFDAYLYQMIENKQRYIGQVFTSKTPARVMQEIDEVSLSYGEIKALATGDPAIIEHCQLMADVSKLKTLKASHLSQRYELEDKVLKHYPAQIRQLEEEIAGYAADIERLAAQTKPPEGEFAGIVIGKRAYTDKKAAGETLLKYCQAKSIPDPEPFGEYRGFPLELSFDTMSREYKLTVRGQLSHKATLGTDVIGNFTRLDHVLDGMATEQSICEEELEGVKTQMESAKAGLQIPFPREAELAEKTARLAELTLSLRLEETSRELLDGVPDEGDRQPQQKSARERDDER